MTTPVYSDYNYGQHQSNSGRSSSANRTVASIILVGFVVLVVLVKGIRSLCRRRDHHREQVREDEGSGSPSDGADPRAATPPAEVETAGAAVVCMYRRSDGGQDATCPVCLSDFADGEAVSVLPACMHYYHPACIDEWLRARATCPLCRAAPAASAVA